MRARHSLCAGSQARMSRSAKKQHRPTIPRGAPSTLSETQRASRPSRYRRIAAGVATLRPVEVLLLVRMGLMLAALLVLQRFLSLPRLLKVFDARSVQASGARVSLDRLVWLTRGLLRITFRDRYCMKQSLLLFHFLRKWSYPVRLYFGVAKTEDELIGHAWVELDGKPFAEYDDPRETFRVTYSYPAS